MSIFTSAWTGHEGSGAGNQTDGGLLRDQPLAIGTDERSNPSATHQLPWSGHGSVWCLSRYGFHAPLDQATSTPRDIDEESVRLVKTTGTTLGIMLNA